MGKTWDQVGAEHREAMVRRYERKHVKTHAGIRLATVATTEGEMRITLEQHDDGRVLIGRRSNRPSERIGRESDRYAPGIAGVITALKHIRLRYADPGHRLRVSKVRTIFSWLLNA